MTDVEHAMNLLTTARAFQEAAKAARSAGLDLDFDRGSPALEWLRVRRRARNPQNDVLVLDVDI